MSARLEALRELVEALRPQILATHSEHGLQGVSGLVGQYRAALAEIEAIEKAQPKAEGTALDEFTKRLAERQAEGSPVAAKRRQSR